MIYKSKYGEYNIRLIMDKYNDGNNYRIELYSDTEGPIAIATTNFPGSLLSNDVAIRNYSENEGLLDWLLSVNIIAPPHRYIRSGYVSYPICKLLVDPKEYK